MLEFFETLFAEDITQRGIVVEAGHRGAQRGHVEGGAFGASDDLGNKKRLGVGVLLGGFLNVLHKSLELGDVAGTDVHGDGTQEAGFTNGFGGSLGVLRGLAAEVPTAAAEFGAGPDQTVVEVLPN